MAKPRTMPGVLELLPLEQAAFQGMLDTIRRNFERYGFLGIETPAIEYADLLLTKSGGETERQVYFVHSTGAVEQSRMDLVAAIVELPPGDLQDLKVRMSTKVGDLPAWLAARGVNTSKPELALRFDLTVPLARYVAEHERELAFPFRRHQIQRVYRGESAQRGRFREFYQCDIDVIGKDALPFCYDAEIPAVIWSLFTELGFGPFTIQLNNRRLMRGFLEGLGLSDPETQALVLREIDKLDKRGPDHVRGVLCGERFALEPEAVQRLLAFVGVRSRGHDDALAQLDALPAGSETFEQGRKELREVLELVKAFGVPEQRYALNFSIARGLDYYTGTVYETTLDDYPAIGSICSGGRYENLAGHYTSSRLPGVGISIGATRLFWQLREAGLIKAGRSSVEALVTLLDSAHLPRYLELANELRAAGIATEAVLEPRKLARQFQYADRAGIRFVLVLGPDELEQGRVTVKDLVRATQSTLPRAELVAHLRAAREH